MGTTALLYVEVIPSSWKKTTQPEKQTSRIFAVFHIPVGFHATQNICPGVLLSSATGVAAELHTQQNPKKVSLPLAFKCCLPLHLQ